jgi:hypothetical protein
MHAAKGNVVAEVKDADAKLLQAVGDVLKSKIKGRFFWQVRLTGGSHSLPLCPKNSAQNFRRTN